MALSTVLEELIKASVADGVISEKERKVLYAKASAEGISADEIDIIIDGRLQQMQNAEEEKKPKVDKCPVCGEIIPAMSATCPNCGYVIDAKDSENFAVRGFMVEMEAELMLLRNGRVESPAKLEGMIRQGKALYGDNPRVKALILEIEDGIAKHKQEMEKKERERKAQITKKNLGCLVGTIVFSALMFVTSYQKKGPDEAFQVMGGAVIMCLMAYAFYFYRRINKK